MPLSLALLWIIIISAFAVGAAWYARRYGRPDALIAAFITLTIIANLVASKIIAIDFGFAMVFTPGATLLFSVTFLLTDIVNERFGRAETQRMIVLAVFAQIALILFSYLAVSAPPAPFYANQEAFAAIFGSVPRIAAAGVFTFLVSETLDAYLFHWWRKLTNGRQLWLRNAFSSLPAMAVDSVLFVTLAFYGTMPILPLIIGLVATKWLVGVVDIPFMYLARAVLSGKQ